MKSLPNFASATGFVIVALTFWPTEVIGNSTNFDTCISNVQQGLYGVGFDIGGTDNHGRPVNVSDAVGLTYDLCVRACGGNQEPFDWSEFSMQFTGWLLPWLALVSQLPFGADNKLDNLLSVFLTVGSPTLAAYSLLLTVLNKRWISNRFNVYNFPNRQNAIDILNSLQQAPLDINMDLLPSLVVRPENDQWWRELAKGLNYTETWSISTATSIGWVVLAFVFTVVDSFIGNIQNAINANGQGVGSVWLWLLPIVVGWLQFSPKCDKDHLINAVQDANKQVYVATNDENLVGKPDTEAQAFNVRLLKGSEFLGPESIPSSIPLIFLPANSESSPRQPVVSQPEPLESRTPHSGSSPLIFHPELISLPVHPGSLPLSPPSQLQSPERSESSPLLSGSTATPPQVQHLTLSIGHSRRSRMELSLYRDEGSTMPIYNYARFFPWVRAVDKVSEAFEAASDNHHSHTPVNSRPWVPATTGDFNDANRVGTLQQVNAYCRSQTVQRHHWERANLYRIFFASSLALMLQWGTAGAAIVINWFTPTKGLGCRSGSYLTYAVLSTLIWMLLLSSSILTHCCAARPDGSMISGWRRKIAKNLSITFRRTGKVLAVLNTILIFFVCVLQLANFFDRCFCNSSVFSLREHAYNVILLSADDISGIKAAWIGGVLLAGVSVIVYFLFVWLWVSP